MSIELRIKRLPHAADLALPAYQSTHAAGLDLLAAVPSDTPTQIAPGGRALIPTGIAVAIPAGNEGQIRPRSGLAIQHGVTVLNAPGTIDADYRGELQVILVNHGVHSILIKRGMRIAQLVIAPIQHVNIAESNRLDSTERAEAGFGSTGIAATTVKNHD